MKRNIQYPNLPSAFFNLCLLVLASPNFHLLSGLEHTHPLPQYENMCVGRRILFKRGCCCGNECLFWKSGIVLFLLKDIETLKWFTLKNKILSIFTQIFKPRSYANVAIYWFGVEKLAQTKRNSHKCRPVPKYLINKFLHKRSNPKYRNRKITQNHK